MLNIIAVILIILWLIGIVLGQTIGNFVYILLVAGVVLLLVDWRRQLGRAPGRRRLRKGLIAAAVLLVASGTVLLSIGTRLTPYVRDRAVSAVNERFASEVELESIQVSMFPRIELLGEGLHVRHRGRRDVPPLISIESFSGGAGALGLLGKPLHVQTIDLNGLVIRLPPGGLNGDKPKNDATAGQQRPTSDTSFAPTTSAARAGAGPLVIDRIVSLDARLEIASRDPTKLPRVFEIHDLVMRDFGLDRASAFEASLTNPKPQGRIVTTGSFGPWHAQEPRQTPLEGTYRFEDADLNTIKGIGGRLSSTGSFGGILERIAVRGETDTPDFMVDISGTPVPLHTQFEAVVDGTNGDTRLENVQATILQSVILARGAVVRSEDIKGRRISLDVSATKARIEDLLALAVKSSAPPLTGLVSLETSLLLPAGEQDVIDRLELNGKFTLAQAQFTNVNVQNQIERLSRTGQGQEYRAEGGSVVSNLKGQFVLNDSVLRFSQLTFAVPGAIVQLAGAYELRGERFDFAGDLLLDAALHEMTSGFKSLIARVAQPFFRRPGGGSKLPIKVSGTRAKPSFGLDVKRAVTPG